MSRVRPVDATATMGDTSTDARAPAHTSALLTHLAVAVWLVPRSASATTITVSMTKTPQKPVGMESEFKMPARGG